MTLKDFFKIVTTEYYLIDSITSEELFPLTYPTSDKHQSVISKYGDLTVESAVALSGGMKIYVLQKTTIEKVVLKMKESGINIFFLVKGEVTNIVGTLSGNLFDLSTMSTVLCSPNISTRQVTFVEYRDKVGVIYYE